VLHVRTGPCAAKQPSQPVTGVLGFKARINPLYAHGKAAPRKPFHLIKYLDSVEVDDSKDHLFRMENLSLSLAILPVQEHGWAEKFQEATDIRTRHHWQLLGTSRADPYVFDPAAICRRAGHNLMQQKLCQNQRNSLLESEARGSAVRTDSRKCPPGFLP